MNINILSKSIIVLVVIPCIGIIAGNNQLAIEGVYTSVSESEWDLILELKEGNIAEITLESWHPGAYDSADISKTDARWYQQGNKIVLKYNNITDTLVYDNNLSLEELGKPGGVPGLHQICAYDPNSLIANIMLWSQNHRLQLRAEPKIAIIPIELLKVANDHGWGQFDDFYDKADVLYPCFLFGYKQFVEWRDSQNSAVFWGRYKGYIDDYSYLIFASRSSNKDKFDIDEVMKWEGNYGGLSFFYDSLVTLDQFVYVKDRSKRGPEEVRMKDRGIRSYYDGAETIFYKYKGEWLFRESSYTE